MMASLRAEYRRTTRAMVHRLLNTGSFQLKEYNLDESGNLIVSEVDGTIEQLNGMLSFIDSVNLSNKRIVIGASSKAKGSKLSERLNCNGQVYRHFLFLKIILYPKKPLIICEGKTDNIYL